MEGTLLILVLGVAAGLLGSLLGLGGGVFIIPAATLLLGVPVHQAVATSIVSVIATSSGAAAGYVRDRLVNIRMGSFLELATTSGAVLGAVLASRLPERALAILFSGILLYSAYTMFQRRNNDVHEVPVPDPLAESLGLAGRYYDKAEGKEVQYTPANVPKGFGVMALAGIVSGLLGIGSGALKVLGMDVVMRLPMKVSTATSNFMIGVTGAASAGYYFSRGLVSPELAGPVALGVLLGARMGSALMNRIKSSTLRALFVPVLVYVAIQMLLKGLQA